jgi:hypothetical protein
VKRYAPLALACLGLLAAPAWSDSSIQQKTVQFAKGKDSVTLKGHIKGDQTIDYKLVAREGQTMTVTLKSSNRMNYFNILPPGTDSALFVSADSSNHFSGALPKNGAYTLRVYLMRAAARRNEAADYSLDIRITGH